MSFDYNALLKMMESGLRLSDVQDVLLRFHSGDESFERLVGCYLAFGEHGLLIEAIRETDGVQVVDVPSLANWLEDRRLQYARYDYDENEFSLVVQASRFFSDRIGLPLLDYWACMDEVGVVDSVDVAFGDLLLPTDKVICVGSELIFLTIHRASQAPLKWSN